MKTSGTHRYVALFAAVAVLLSACEEKETPIVPTFPEAAQHTVAPGDEFMVTFHAALDWQLASDASWCKVDGLFLDTSGKAGEQAVKFVISDEGRDFEEDKATITLRMGEQSEVVAHVTRTPIAYEFKVTDGTTDYTDGQSVVIGSTATVTMQVEGNFSIEQLHIGHNAQWLDITRSDNQITLSVLADSLKYTINNATDSLTFVYDNHTLMQLHLQYTGMDARTIGISPATQWALTVAADGKTYKDGMYSTTQEVYEAPIQVMLTALNDAYELLYVHHEKSTGYAIVDAEESWIEVADDHQGGISINFAENAGAKRKGYLFVLPQFLADSVAAGKDAFLFEELEGVMEIKAEAERYLIAEFTQEGVIDNSFSVINGAGKWEDMPVEAETDSDWLDIAMGYCVSAENVYHTQLEFAIPYIINPMIDMEVWDINAGADIQIWGKSGKQYLVNEDFIAEPALTEDGLHYYMQLRSYVEEDYIIYFMDANKIALKALVVELAEFEE